MNLNTCSEIDFNCEWRPPIFESFCLAPEYMQSLFNKNLKMSKSYLLKINVSLSLLISLPINLLKPSRDTASQPISKHEHPSQSLPEPETRDPTGQDYP